jgi:hypothetical protein
MKKIEDSILYFKNGVSGDMHFFANEEQAIFWAKTINGKIDVNLVLNNLKLVYFNVYIIKHSYFNGVCIIQHDYQYNVDDLDNAILKFQELKSQNEKLQFNSVYFTGVSNNISVVLEH